MARKSRKEAQIAQLTNMQSVPCTEPEPVAPVRYKAGLYARLSMFNLGRSDSETIDNQIQYLRRFAAKQPDIEAVDLYVDNGHTGTNFDRPEFERMIDDIRTGKLNCLICRDLSRFGRSYLEAGFYIQTIFPFLGVRFIAINDEFDSLTSDPDSLAVSMKNIINAFYSRDISQKVSSTIDVKRKAGPFVFGSIPYGYLRDQEDPSRYVIDEEAAPIVHMIFSWAMEGASFSRIAKDLTALGIPTPQRHIWLRSGKKVRRKGADIWSSLTVQFILTNRAYTGDFICTKARIRKYDPSENKRYQPDDWTIYPDNHPAYISKEDFQLLQDYILPGHYHQMGRKEQDAKASSVSALAVTCPEPLRGILYCGLCGRRMVPIQTIRSDGTVYFRYRCKGVPNERRTGHSPFIMEAGSLHFTVFWQVNLQIRYAMDTKELYRRFSAEGAALRLKAKRQAEINLLNGKIAACKQKRTRAFEDLSEGFLDAKTYQALRDKLSDELEDLTSRLAACRERMGNVDTYFTPENRWLKAFTSTGQLDLSDPEALKALVKKVEVFPDDHIRITYHYRDWMEPLLEILSEAEEEKGNRDLQGLPAPAPGKTSYTFAPVSTFVHSEQKLNASAGVVT